jgi:hypothetical protein
LRTQEGISKFTNYYLFYLDYPLDVCRKNVIEGRGGKLDETILTNRKKSHDKMFEVIDVKHKYRLSGTIEENIDVIIKTVGLNPCNCMNNVNFLESITARVIE